MAENKAFLEKRVHSRVPVKIPVYYRLVQDPKELKNIHSQTAITKDLSLDGMYIKTYQPPTVGDVFQLEIVLPESQKKLFAFAEVIWINEMGAGIHFLLMADEDREALKGYLDEVSSN